MSPRNVRLKAYSTRAARTDLYQGIGFSYAADNGNKSGFETALASGMPQTWEQVWFCNGIGFSYAADVGTSLVLKGHGFSHAVRHRKSPRL
jgi:hypothetical protein